VIDHFGINCSDFSRSTAFYDKVLGVLGYTRQMDFQVAIGYGRGGKPDFWIADINAGDATGPNREVHFAFQATDVDAVKAFYDAALEAGAESLHAPRLWPEYHPRYYGAFVRDPDGNNVEAVFHGASPEG
jgi:catechol 2,3-dioxygenase-like lactoylglutathione lyase family enzyme